MFHCRGKEGSPSPLETIKSLWLLRRWSEFWRHVYTWHIMPATPRQTESNSWILWTPCHPTPFCLILKICVWHGQLNFSMVPLLWNKSEWHQATLVAFVELKNNQRSLTMKSAATQLLIPSCQWQLRLLESSPWKVNESMAGEMQKAIVNLMGNQSWWRNHEILERFESLLPCKSWTDTSWTSFKGAFCCWYTNQSILRCTLWSNSKSQQIDRGCLCTLKGCTCEQEVYELTRGTSQTGKSWTSNQSHSPLFSFARVRWALWDNFVTTSNRHDSGTNTHTNIYDLWIFTVYSHTEGQIDPLHILAQIGLRCR